MRFSHKKFFVENFQLTNALLSLYINELAIFGFFDNLFMLKFSNFKKMYYYARTLMSEETKKVNHTHSNQGVRQTFFMISKFIHINSSRGGLWPDVTIHNFFSMFAAFPVDTAKLKLSETREIKDLDRGDTDELPKEI